MTDFDQEWSTRHDLFNHFWLPVIIALDVWYIFTASSLSLLVFQAFFLLYLGLDMVWIFLKPQSVASPKIILFHHVITSSGVACLQVMDAEMASIVSIGALVEANTYFRLLRKSYRGNLLVEALFYTSWFGIRCICGPWLLAKVWDKVTVSFVAALDGKGSNNIFYINCGLFVIALVLNALNAKWTYDLVVGGSWRRVDSRGL